MKKKMRVLTAVALGFFFTILLFEGWLRVFAQFNTPKNPDVGKSYYKAPFTILALGNSFTAGSGAPPGQSYPDQLREIIRERFPDLAFQVINEGTGGQNSAQLLRKLEANIETYKPNLVLLQTGQPNWWNPFHYGDYLEREGDPKATLPGGILNKAYDLAFNLKVFRFIVITYHQVVVERKLKEAYASDQACCQNSFPDKSAHECLIAGRSLDQCVELLRNAIRSDPKNSSNYSLLGTILFDRLHDQWGAMSTFIEGINAVATIDPNFNGNNYLAMKERLPKLEGPVVRAQVSLALLLMRMRSPEKVTALLLDRQDCASWAQSDLKEIIRQLRKKNIKVILQNYPPLPKVYLVDEINGISRRVARQMGVPFVDHEKIYQRLWDSGLKRENYHADHGRDPHPNAKGYGIMARNVFNVIMKMHYIPQQAVRGVGKKMATSP